MSTQPAPLGIVVWVDGSAASRVAVDWAARDAAMRRVPLTLVHVLAEAGVQAWIEVPLPSAVIADEQANARKILRDALGVVEAATTGAELFCINQKIVSGQPIPTLADFTKDADMIVVGSRGLGKWGRRILGSVDGGLVQHAHCPVAVIHDEDPLIPHPAQAPRRRGHRRLTGIGARHRDRVRRGVAPRGRPGRRAHLERRRSNCPTWGGRRCNRKRTCCWRSDWLVGRSATPMSRCGGWCAATSRAAACSRRLSRDSCWWLAATVEGDSPECCSAPWVRRWCRRHGCR